MTGGIRCFRADDAHDALAQVRSALGADAVIVSTREVGGPSGRRRVEVAAARPEQLAAVRAPTGPGTRPAAAGSAAPSRPVAAAGGAPPPDDRAPLPRDAVLLYRCLIARGMEGVIAEELIRRAFRVPGDDPVARLREAVARFVPTAPAPWLARRGRRVLALVGPTGSGKTTSLAKIAARAVLDSGLRVALATVDTYRVGAGDQLARYGSMLRVPVAIARDRGELVRALEANARADLVLVDTAGRSSAEATARQAELLTGVPGAELLLVASAATGWRDLAAVAARYAALGVAQILFAKTDEAAAPAGVLGVCVRAARPVCAIADGQRVPEDLRAATPDWLVDFVLGARRAAPPRRT